MTERPVELIALADVEYANRSEILFYPVGHYLPDPCERVVERRPVRLIRGTFYDIRTPAVHIRRNSDIHLLRMCEAEILHESDKIRLAELSAETRIERTLLGNARRR